MNTSHPPRSVVAGRLQSVKQSVVRFIEQFWTQTINIGVHPGLSDWERKRARLLNGITALTLIIFLPYTLSLLNSPDYVTFWLCVVMVGLCMGMLGLTYLRLFNAAAWYFLLTGTCFYAFTSVAKKHDGSDLVLISYAVIGMIFFRSFWSIVLNATLNIAVFFWARYAQTVIKPFLYIPEMTDVYNQNTLLTIVGVLAIVYYFKIENSRQEALMAQKNEQLQVSLHELHRAQAQLIQREKLASLGELTAGIAHEIQNPLNFVNNFAEASDDLITELADEQTKGQQADYELQADLIADLQQNISRISQHGQRAAGIVRGMLEHSRVSTGQREPTNLNTLTIDYLRLVYNSLPAKGQALPICFHTDLDPTLPPIDIIAEDVGRVLTNLFSNAFYAVWQRQQHTADYQPEVWVQTRQEAAGLVIRVRDNGTGIDAAIQPKIFQPFFTTKPTGSGTGLGLSLSYDIITKGYGGTLTVQSEPGQGAEFIITLPTH